MPDSETVNGFVRPALAVAFGAAFIYLTIVGQISAEAFLGVASMIFVWYFKSRDEVKKT
jgi:hypothetical protein